MLGRYLKRFRLKNNLTQIQMAEKLETSQTYYSLVENGKKQPGFNFIKRLAVVLEVEESFIRSLL